MLGSYIYIKVIGHKDRFDYTTVLGLIYDPESQSHSQDLETGCPKFAIVKYLGVQISKGDHNILRFQLNMYESIKIQCHGNSMEMKRFKYMLEIDILRNYSQKNLGVLSGAF